MKPAATERTELASPWRGLLANSGFALFWQLFRAATLAAYLLLLTKTLGAASYGLLSGPLSLAVVFGGFSGGGAGLMLLRDAARDATQQHSAWSRYLGAAIISMPLGLLGYGLAVALLVPGQVPLSIWLPLGLAEVVVVPCISASALAFQSVESLGWSGAVMAVPAVARLAAAAGTALSGWQQPLQCYVLLHLAGALAAGGFAAVALWRRLDLAWTISWPMARWWRQCGSYSLMYFVANASVDVDKSLALRNGGAVVAGRYGAGYRIASILSLPAVALIQSVLPRLLRQDEAAVRQRGRLLARVTLAILGYSLVAALVLATAAGSVVGLLGSSYAALQPVFPLLGLLLVMYNLRMVPSALLQASDRPAFRALAEVSALIVLFAGSALLVPRYGVRGAALTAVASESWIFVTGWFMALRLLRRPAPA